MKVAAMADVSDEDDEEEEDDNRDGDDEADSVTSGEASEANGVLAGNGRSSRLTATGSASSSEAELGEVVVRRRGGNSNNHRDSAYDNVVAEAVKAEEPRESRLAR